jgi:hypothetical protein
MKKASTFCLDFAVNLDNFQLEHGYLPVFAFLHMNLLQILLNKEGSANHDPKIYILSKSSFKYKYNITDRERKDTKTYN